MITSPPLVELRGVAARYGTAEVLREIDLAIEPGDSLAIVGPSGSGKSTLLHVLGTLLPASAGQVRYGGVDVATLRPNELARLRNREIGFVFQAHHLLPQCSALENVLVPTLAERPRRHEAAARARELLARIGLADRGDRRPGELSGGERQRVAVARALVLRPRIVFADEPTGSLDAAGAERLADLLCELAAAESMALVVVTHAQALARRMRRVLALRDGSLAPDVGGA